MPKKMELEIWIAVDKKNGKPEQSTPIHYTERSCQEWVDHNPWTKKKLFVQKGKLILPEHDYPAYVCTV